jgi:hypothetical protein
VNVEFQGLTVFVLPSSGSKEVDVAFVNTTANPLLKGVVYPHGAFLKVVRDEVDPKSDRIPSAVDDDYAYYAIAGRVDLVPSQSAGSTQNPPQQDLAIGSGPRSEPDAADCVKDDRWNSINWVLDFKELHPDAVLDPNWQTSAATLGWLRLAYGHLEDEMVPVDQGDRMRYTMYLAAARKERLLKDRVRYRLDTPFAHFQFASGGAVIVPGGSAALISHGPSPSMQPDPKTKALTDYYAIYELLKRDVLDQIGDYKNRPILYDRKTCSAKATPKSANCAAVIVRRA